MKSIMFFCECGFRVTITEYCNENIDKEIFDEKLKFNIKLIPYTYTINGGWVLPT